MVHKHMDSEAGRLKMQAMERLSCTEGDEVHVEQVGGLTKGVGLGFRFKGLGFGLRFRV